MAIRGRPKSGRPVKRVVAIRLSPELFEEVQSLSPNVSQAVEKALMAWVRSERRKAAKAGPPAQHVARPTAGEITAPRKRETAS
jgi:hypothetical protein